MRAKRNSFVGSGITLFPLIVHRSLSSVKFVVLEIVESRKSPVEDGFLRWERGSLYRSTETGVALSN